MSERIAEVTDAFIKGVHACVLVRDTRGREDILSFHVGDFIDPVAAFGDEFCKRLREAK